MIVEVRARREGLSRWVIDTCYRRSWMALDPLDPLWRPADPMMWANSVCITWERAIF